MNLRDPKNQIFIAVFILFGAAIYYWSVGIYSSYNEKISSLVVEQSTLASKLNSVKQKAATKEELDATFRELQKRSKRVAILLPETKQDESFLNQVHGAAQLTNSVVKKITPLGTVPTEYYETNNYSVEIESSYHGLGRFCAQVGNFPFIVNISAMQLRTSKDGGGATLLDPAMDIKAEETVIAIFKLSTYNVRQGAAG